MSNPMLAELDEVVRLMEKATPGPWESASRGRYYVGQQEDEASVHGADDADIDEVSNVSPLHLADTIRGDCYKPDADLIAAAVNFLRTHHATLADMAKRLEAAERDASGEREESWEVWQDGICVAGSDSLADAQHYMMMYGQDGPVKMVHVVTFRSDVIETVPAAQLAIDATQEGEG